LPAAAFPWATVLVFAGHLLLLAALLVRAAAEALELQLLEAEVHLEPQLLEADVQLEVLAGRGQLLRAAAEILVPLALAEALAAPAAAEVGGCSCRPCEPARCQPASRA
jgi:hypothetical protein